MATPHDGAQAFMPKTSFGGGFTQSHFGQSMANGAAQMGMSAQMAQNSQTPGVSAASRNYQLQMQAQARQMQAQAQAHARAMNGIPSNTGQAIPNPPPSAMSQAPFNLPKANNPEEFAKSIQTYMAARGRSVDLNPVICGRPFQLIRLYGAVLKLGGSGKLTKLNQWPLLANSFGFPPQQHGQAAQELQMYWMNNVAPYEAAWMASQQKQRVAVQAGVQNQMSPTRENYQGQEVVGGPLQRTSSDLVNAKMNGHLSGQTQQQLLNSLGQPQTPSQQQAPSPMHQHRTSVSQPFDTQQSNGAHTQVPEASPQKRPQSEVQPTIEAAPEPSMPKRAPIQDPFKPAAMSASRMHGPINVDEMYSLGQQIAEYKPVVPQRSELGIIDIHALTMGIKSGMHAETRVALDTLVTLSTDPQLQLSLSECEDLMETLVDCAQKQVDFLIEHSAEVSDDMLLSSYEELVRACRMEASSIQNTPAFGSVEYDLDRAADRLICITTLIRNFSFYEANFIVLGQPEVVRLLSTVIRSLGTKESLLRTHRNTLDFMKDVIIYLSNLSTSLNLPGKEEALCILHFLLAFAPTPPPVSANTIKVTFTAYSSTLHKYMPSAVDSLAKLLARDEPNRTYYKAIFHADVNSTPPFELLTRTFGLAISPIPAGSSHIRALVEARKPFLLQGMLAAEILAVLAPSSDHTLARSWLESEDNFAGSLLKLVNFLAADRSIARPPQPGRNPPDPDANGYGAITNRAMAVLKTLVQKSRTVDAEGTVHLPGGVLPKKEIILGAMVAKDIDAGLLRQLCLYAEMEE